MLSKNQAKNYLLIFFTMFQSDFVQCSEETPGRGPDYRTPPPLSDHSDGSIVPKPTPKHVRFKADPKLFSAKPVSLSFFQQGPPQKPRQNRQGLTIELITPKSDPLERKYEEIQPNEEDVDYGAEVVNEKLSASKPSRTKNHLSIFPEKSLDWLFLFDTYVDYFSWRHLAKRLELSGYFKKKPNLTKERLLEVINLIFKPILEQNGTGETISPRTIWYNLEPESDSDQCP